MSGQLKLLSVPEHVLTDRAFATFVSVEGATPGTEVTVRLTATPDQGATVTPSSRSELSTDGTALIEFEVHCLRPGNVLLSASATASNGQGFSSAARVLEVLS